MGVLFVLCEGDVLDGTRTGATRTSARSVPLQERRRVNKEVNKVGRTCSDVIVVATVVRCVYLRCSERSVSR